jgi:hypothetical protein
VKKEGAEVNQLLLSSFFENAFKKMLNSIGGFDKINLVNFTKK